MTEGVRPVGPVTRRDRRDAERRVTDRRADAAREASTNAAASTSIEQAIVVVSEVIDETPPHPARPAVPPAPAAAFAAQLIGQGGQRKGIRGGPPVMDAARNTYLGTEYSGGNDRRPPSGRAKRTDV